MGVDIARAALAAGHPVVATGRNPDAVTRSPRRARRPAGRQARHHERREAQSAVRAAVDRFGRIDVLVNNAANFFGGFFEELRPSRSSGSSRRLGGPMTVTRAVLPVMRTAAVRAHRLDLLDRRHRRAGVLLGLRRREVRARRVDGVAGARGRAVRHPDDDRRAGLLPHRAAQKGRQPTRSSRSTTTPSGPRRPARLGSDERPAGRRPGEARAGARHIARRGGTACAVDCRRRRRRRPSSRR